MTLKLNIIFEITLLDIIQEIDGQLENITTV